MRRRRYHTPTSDSRARVSTKSRGATSDSTTDGGGNQESPGISLTSRGITFPHLVPLPPHLSPPIVGDETLG